jgi:pSer/pThr/pTyr-binding forkhead associated (FHA) protein
VGALHRFEQRLEQVVTGAFARAFRSAVQPMEIAAALQREVDNSAQILSRNRRIAPNDFTIDLSPTDYDRLATYGDALSSELAAMLHEHAQEQGYIFAGPIRMSFQRVDDLTTGRFRVRSSALAQVTPAAGQPASDTAVREASAYLDIAGTRHPLLEPGLVIGRGSGSDVRVDDPGVSRRHVEFRVQMASDGPHVSLVDLGSTNGTTVAGHRVQHAVLGDGSIVQIGATRIEVHVIGSEPKVPRPAPPAAAADRPFGAPSRAPQQPSYRPPDDDGADDAGAPPAPASPESPPSDPRRQHWSG